MLEDLILTEQLVCNQLRKLKVGKATSIDGIEPNVLVECADVLCKRLWIIYKLSLQIGRVLLEESPVSLTSHVCKVLEALVRDVIVAHFQKYNLINDSQHGFVKGKSCLTNLLGFLRI
jgi:hypothetical protein